MTEVVGSFNMNETAASGDQFAGFNEIPHTGSFVIAESRSNTRLTWRTEIMNSSGILNNNQCWFYLDNIKVSIAQ